jgi:DNA-binding transcriptional LysR family regulator
MLQLKLFVSVAQTHNFSKTAEQFFLTQPAVSHSIKSLESQLEATLFQRNRHSVVLTMEGEEYLTYANRILELNAVAENRVKNISRGRSGHIRIAMLSSSSKELSECLSEFYIRNPSIQVDVDMLEGSELLKALGGSGYDFFFCVQHMLPSGNMFDFLATCREQLHLFIHRDIADKIDLNEWSTIREYPFVSVPQTDTMLSRQVLKVCRTRGLEPKIINYYNRAETVVLSVNSGVGVAILPAALGRLYQCPNVVTFPIEGSDAVVNSVVAWKENALSASGKEFQSVIYEQYS